MGQEEHRQAKSKPLDDRNIKILNKILAKRMELYINKDIQHEHVEFLPGI